MGSILENSHNSKPSSITSHDDDGDFMASSRNLGLENSHNLKPSSITSHDDDGDFMASFRNLGLENSHHSKPCSITSHDDDGDFMDSLQNLGFIEFPETSLNNNFGVGSSSFSVSLEQGSQKEEISYGGQVNKALGKKPVNSCVSETSSESPICQGGYLRSYLHSRRANNTNNDQENSPNLSNYSSYGPACAPNLSNCGMGGYNLDPTNGYNLHKKSGGSVPEGVDLVMMAKTRILHHHLGGGDMVTRRRILVEVIESMIAPNGHHVFQKLMITSNKDSEFQIIVTKLTLENRSLIDASFDMHGSFSVQKFIKFIKWLKKSPMTSTVTSSILSTSLSMMKTHPSASPAMYQCLNLLGVLPNKNTQKTKSQDGPSDDHGLDQLNLEQYGFVETSLETTILVNNTCSWAQLESDDNGLDFLDLKQYGFFETTPDDHGLDVLDLKQYGFFETIPEPEGTTSSANNTCSSAQFESDDGTTKASLNPISSNESKLDSAAGSVTGSTNYITCLNKDCYKCLSFMDISHSGSTCNLEMGSLTLNVGDFRVRAKPEASGSGTESAATCKSDDS